VRPTNPITAIAMRGFALTTALLLAACGGEVETGGAATADAGEYVVERSTAEGVETVRTVSGSRWGGNARLVEELSIGEEIGEDAFLFGSITAAWATEDRIYVVDSQIPVVRAFDHQGNFLHQVGRTGQGPGEYNRPMGVAVKSNGEVLISDLGGARLSTFDTEGNSVDDWSLGSPQAALGLQLTYDGEIYTRMLEMPEEMNMGEMGELREGMQPVGADGELGEPIFPPEIDYEPPTVEVTLGGGMGGRSMSMAILPFTPSYEWAFAPGGEMLAGVGNEYSFQIHAPDGRQTAVEKAWDPVPVDPGERGFRADNAASQFRQMAPDFSIPESEVPDSKAAFTRLQPDRSGRVWVARQGPSVPDETCAEADHGGGMAIMLSSSGGASVVSADSLTGGDDEGEDDSDCWANTYTFDVFELATGEFLGTVPAPEMGFTRPLFANDDTVLAAVTDEMGTVRLKKYRLVID